ncbi:MAG: PLP-dependent aminotransferase family protein [Methanobacteriota archaeon]
MADGFEHLFSERARGMKASMIRELLKLTHQRDIVLFAGGLPNPAAFPVEDVKGICKDLLAKSSEKTLQYGTTEGVTELREQLVERMKRKSIDCDIKNTIITSGSQQGLDLVSKVFIDPKDMVVVGAPTFLGGAGVFTSYQAQMEAIPIDEEGMPPDVLEDRLWKLHRHGRNFKMLYMLPTFQNPSGVTSPESRRKKIIDICAELDMIIIEDDPYSDIRYSGDDLRPVKSFDKEGRVIYMSTFSKILAPGLRVAWLTASEDIVSKLVIAKQSTDLCTNTFGQYIAHEYMARGLVDKHIEVIKKLYKAKRDIMLKSMKDHFPEGVKWTRPDGGMFCWVTVPDYIDTPGMFDKAIENNVAYVPGNAFYTNDGGRDSMRLNFTHPTDEMIGVGIERLAKVIKDEMRHHAKHEIAAPRDKDGMIEGV